MTPSRARIYQLFKYAVYVFLAMNVYWFFADERLAATLRHLLERVHSLVPRRASP